MVLTSKYLRQHLIEHPLQPQQKQAKDKDEHVLTLSLSWIKKFHLYFAPSPRGIIEFHSVKQVTGPKQNEAFECQVITNTFRHFQLPFTSLPDQYQKFNAKHVKRKLTSQQSICGLQPFPADCRLIELHHPDGDILYCDPLGQFSPIMQCSTAADWVNYEFLPRKPSPTTEAAPQPQSLLLQVYALVEKDDPNPYILDKQALAHAQQYPFVRGSIKTLDFKDNESVTLHLNRGYELTDEQIRTNHQMVRVLRPFSTICPCIAISRSSMICENAGQDLSVYLAHGGSMFMHQFTQLCIEMGEIHDLNIVLGDIKLANLAINDDGAMVRMIDLDSLQTMQQIIEHFWTLVMTPRYITQDLHKALKEQKHDKGVHVSRDNYALLLCMIQATTTAEIRTLINNIDGLQQKGLFSCIKVPTEQKIAIEEWVIKHFLSDYHQALFDFLTDPYKNSLAKPLSQMLA